MKGCPQGRELQEETGSHVLFILRRRVHYSDNAHGGRQQCESQKYMRRLSLLWPGGIYKEKYCTFPFRTTSGTAPHTSQEETQAGRGPTGLPFPAGCQFSHRLHHNPVTKGLNLPCKCMKASFPELEVKKEIKLYTSLADRNLHVDASGLDPSS